MRIQKIYSNLCTRHSFKAENLYEHWDYDYGTYYNEISLKDAIVSSVILSGAMAFVGILFTNQSQIKEFCKKIVPSLKKEHFDKII